jgi:hypothetical protein
MDFFGILKDFDPGLVSKYMLWEFLIGATIGFILSRFLQFKARQASNLTVTSPKEYLSLHFGRQLPRHTFDPLPLPPVFIIVESANDQVISERFFSLAGSSTKATYNNGEYQGHGYAAWESPVYCCTVVFPCLVGFLLALLPFVGNFFTPLFYSGLAWMMVTGISQFIWTIIQSRRDTAN